MKAFVNARLFWCVALAVALCLVLAGPAAAQAAEDIDFSNFSNLAMWSALVAMAVPWAAAWLNRANTTSTVKWSVFAGVCVVAAVGTTFFQGLLLLDPTSIIRSLLIVATLAGVYYRLWYGALKQFERDHGPGA